MVDNLITNLGRKKISHLVTDLDMVWLRPLSGPLPESWKSVNPRIALLETKSTEIHSSVDL